MSRADDPATAAASLRLRAPRLDDEEPMRAAHAELAGEGFAVLFRPELSWSAQLDQLEREAAGVGLTRGQVQADFLVAVTDQTAKRVQPVDSPPADPAALVGRVSIRHTLTPVLWEIGGHVGYAIRPAYRGRGYATQMLRLSLARLRDLGVDDVLVTCDEHNLASRATIERCGGVLEDIRRFSDEAPAKRRYWIEAD